MSAVHERRAVDHLRTAAAIKLELDDLRAVRTMPRPVLAIEKSSAEMRLSLKLAEIEATLAVAEAFRDWTDVGREGLDAAPLELVKLPKDES